MILGREFAVSGLRAVKAEEGIIIPASKLGKFKTISQVLAVIIIILENVYPPLRGVGVWAMYIAVAITLISGIDYFLKFKLLDKE